MTSRRYMSDMSDTHWPIIEKKIVGSYGPGRPRELDMREVVNAILYREKTRCSWRMLPSEFPPRTSIEYYYHMWDRDGRLKYILDIVRRRRMV